MLELGMPETLVHGDFHSGNVALGPRGHVIFDWSDGAVSHPCFDLPVALGAPDQLASHAEQQPLLEAYLEPWRAAGYASPRLRAALELGSRLGPLYHAVSYHRILQACGQVTRAELGHALGALLELAVPSP